MSGFVASSSRRLFSSLAIALASFQLVFTPSAAADGPSPAAPLMKLLASGRLPAERQAAVVEMICKRGNDADLAVVLKMLEEPKGLPGPVRVKVLDWLSEAAATRKVKPAGDLVGLKKLLSTGDAGLQLGAVKLASQWKVAGMAAELQTILADEKSTASLQKAALEGLVALDDAASRGMLEKLAKSAPTVKTRILATAGLARSEPAVAARAAAEVLAAATSKDDPAPLIDAFLNRKEGADKLAEALTGKKLPADVAKLALRYMYSVGRSDAALSALLSEAAGIAADPPLPTPEEVAKISADVVAKGDALRGEIVFRSASVSCFKCHALSQAGGNVGPELSAVGSISPVDYVVNSILNPNLAIKEQYVTKTIITSDGNVLTGIIVDRDDTKVRLKDASGQVVVVPTDDIDTEVEGKSLMPQGLTKFLTHQETLDLMKFISQLGKPGDYAIRKTETMQRWRSLREPAAELLAEVPNVEQVREFILDLPADRWNSVYAKVAGSFPLNEVRPADGPAVVYLQGEVEVTEEGPVTVDLQTSEKFNLWVDAEPFGDQKQFDTQLTAGTHRITVRVELTPAPDSGKPTEPELRLTLRRPEGSSAQFVAVGGK